MTRLASIRASAADIFQELSRAHRLSLVVYARHELQMSVLWSAPHPQGDQAGQADRSMLFSAAGQCYLAFCGEQERSCLLQELGPAGGRESLLLARDRLWLPQMIESTRKRGYALYAAPSVQLGGGMLSGGNKAAEELAVPILIAGELVACMAVACLDDKPRNVPIPERDLYPIAQRAAGDIASRVPA
ncbi:hypothetical protein [Marinobacterium lutimaris]|nr:hypothetical protein [Marinobacterium lutimaris]